MAEFSVKELMEWNEIIEKKVKEFGLDYYEQEFEVCSYEDMIGYETYVGMPSHYPHWSYGKNYDKIKTLHKYNLTGLPYEMVINSNPCIAYLMQDNTLLLQILTIAHVYGHNDFFKCNRLFKEGTRAEVTIETFKNHAERIRGYISDPTIGYEKVEKILNAAHAVKFQTGRVVGERRKSDKQKVKEIIHSANEVVNEHPLIVPKKEFEKPLPDFHKIPLEPEPDLLWFLGEYGKMDDWEVDILNIVREETRYFIPQMETKIMNEGWASYWHYNILKSLDLDQGLHLEFLKRHNQVIRPHTGQMNPYYVGFKIFEDLVEKNNGDTKKIFEAREMERDSSFLRKYLTRDLCQELNLFEYVKIGNDYVVEEVSDEKGWRKIRDYLGVSVGVGAIPVINVVELVQKDRMLVLEHQYDGRELELNYAYETLKHVVDLWDGKVALITNLDGKRKMITCDETKKVTLSSMT